MIGLQWGGRFKGTPDPRLLQFGSCLEGDLVLAPFDVRCSLAHVAALHGGKIINDQQADELIAALRSIDTEISEGGFASYARRTQAEDVHGAIDERVRELAPTAGDMLHAGRSRNDQVATTLLLYCADRAQRAKSLSLRIASHFVERAEGELDAKTVLDACTHWQPAQPILLGFWLAAAAEPFVRDARRFERAHMDALESCPLGSGAVAGSTLPLDRYAACAQLGFGVPSRNALDAIGNRDVALDLAHACARALVNASRVCEELIIWCAPAFSFARLDDGASTGSSLMPQKRNPDPLELVRAYAADAAGRFAGALTSVKGLALSYHRDLQVTKGIVMGIVESAIPALEAFYHALSHVHFTPSVMRGMAGEEYTVATDIADSLIKRGMSARAAHVEVGARILAYENECQPLDWPDARESVELKCTPGSTHPREVQKALDELRTAIRELDE